MTTIAIFPVNQDSQTIRYRAITNRLQSVGRTAGEALDALTAQFDTTCSGTLVVVQPLRPDAFFSADQQRRLGELMAQWRAARDGKAAITAEEQTELDALVEAELQAATQRAANLIKGLPP